MRHPSTLLALGRALAIATLLTSVAGVARAQATLPFLDGQWGIEASAFGGGSLLRFVTPRTALLLNLDVNHSSYDNGPGASPRSRTSNTFTVGAGLRRHAALAPHLASTVEGGLSFAWGRDRAEYGGATGDGIQRTRMFGPYLGFGAQYLVSDHFAVGAAYELYARWVKNRYHDANNDFHQASRNYGAQFTPVYATLYF